MNHKDWPLGNKDELRYCGDPELEKIIEHFQHFLVKGDDKLDDYVERAKSDCSFIQCSHNQPCGRCRFAQLCEIGPNDFFRSLYVDSTTQGDFGHVVRSSVGCLGSEIFLVMCLNLHIPDNAEKHCFEHKSQFLTLKY